MATDSDETSDEINNILAVAPAKGAIYLLLTTYEQSAALNPGGQVYLAERRRGGKTDLLLSTNDALSSMWSSEAGHAWVGSAAGNVWTTAPVAFAAPADPGLDYDAPAPGHRWSVTALPPLRAEGVLPNVTAIWGTSDNDVFAATFEGAVYHWDGAAWVEMSTGVTAGLIELHGTAPDDVYCVGREATLLHYDGAAWSRLPAPDGLDARAVLTGVRAASRDLAHACALSGAILRGDRKGFAIAADTDQPWSGVSHFMGRWILAANPGGAWELSSSGVVPRKTNFAATDVFEVGDLLFFIETDQSPRPSVIEYDPHNPEAPWGRRSF